MAVTLSGKLRGEWTETGSGDLGTPRKVHLFEKVLALGSGNDLDTVWSDQRTLTATSEELDLSGSLTDAFGTTIAFTEVLGFLIYNTSTTSGDELTVGGSASNAFINWVGDASDTVKVKPGGTVWFDTGATDIYAVTAGTGDKLKIDAGAKTITYQIVVYGNQN